MSQNKLRVFTPDKAPEKQTVPIKQQGSDEPGIWKRFKEGDEAAFIWIYQNYFGKLFDYASQFDLDSDLIKDHIQELFIYIRKNRERLADVNSIKFYLIKSIRRRIFSDAKKKFSIVSLFSIDQKKVFEMNISTSTEYNLIDETIQDEIKHRIARALNKLTVRQREAVQHFYYEGHSYQEVAEIMDLKKVKYARKLIYRSVEALRRDLHGLKSTIF
jgi:RNA polymerase sigma-70 factor (ECF subfamily)